MTQTPASRTRRPPSTEELGRTIEETVEGALPGMIESMLRVYTSAGTPMTGLPATSYSPGPDGGTVPGRRDIPTGNGGVTTADRGLFDLFTPVLNATLPAITQAVPGLISAFAGQQRDMGDPTAPATDEEAQTRFFGPLLAALIPAAVHAVPGIIDSLTGARDIDGTTDQAELARRALPEIFGHFTAGVLDRLPDIVATLLGGDRDLDSAPVETDAEVSQRFLGPLLGMAVPALMQGIPALIDSFTRGPDADRGMFGDLTPITWTDLQGGRLRDGDVITSRETPIDGQYTEFVVELADWKTWWKGIKLLDATQAQVGLAEVHDGVKVSDAIRVRSADLPTMSLTLAKAKLAGVHTDMYTLSELQQKAGRRVTLRWTAD